jgi:protein subunit release factor A
MRAAPATRAATEASGRIHFDGDRGRAAEAEEVDIHINEKDLRIDTLLQRPGGQSVNDVLGCAPDPHPTGSLSQQDEVADRESRER